MARHRIPGTALRFAALGADPHVDVEPDAVHVHVGAGFSASIPRSQIAAARVGRTSLPDGAGIHGWRGRWVVNNRLREEVLVLELGPSGRARVYGVPVRLRMLLLSVDDPAALAAELSS